MAESPYRNATDDELIFESGRARQLDAARVEMTRRLKDAVKELKDVVQDANKETSKHSRTLVFLTWVLVILTAVLVVLTVITGIQLEVLR